MVAGRNARWYRRRFGIYTVVLLGKAAIWTDRQGRSAFLRTGDVHGSKCCTGDQIQAAPDGRASDTHPQFPHTPAEAGAGHPGAGKAGGDVPPDVPDPQLRAALRADVPATEDRGLP